LLLIASVVGLIIHFDYPLIVEFLGGAYDSFHAKNNNTADIKNDIF
jgi:hypothetical protein